MHWLVLAIVLTSAAADDGLVPVAPLPAYRFGEEGVLVAGTLYRSEEADFLRGLRRVPRAGAPAEPPLSLIRAHLDRPVEEGWAPRAYLESDWIPGSELVRMAAQASRAFEVAAAWSGSTHVRPARFAVVRTPADYEALVAKLTDDEQLRRQAKVFTSFWTAGGRVGHASDGGRVAATVVSDAVGMAVPPGLFLQTALRCGFQDHAAAFLTGSYEGFGAIDTSERRFDRGGLAGLMAGARGWAVDPRRESLASLLHAELNAITPSRRAAAFALADLLLRRYRERLKEVCAALGRHAYTAERKPKRNEELVAALDVAFRESLEKDLSTLDQEVVELVRSSYALPEERLAELSGQAAEWGAAKAAAFARTARARREGRRLSPADERAWVERKAELERKLLSLKTEF